MTLLWILLAMIALLMLLHLLIELWKERESIRSAYWRWRGKPARERVAAEMNNADRRAAARAAKEQQTEIDVSELIGY